MLITYDEFKYQRMAADAGPSLSSAERSSNFEVIVNLSSLGSGGETHVGLLSLFTHDLHVNVRDVVKRKGLSLFLIKVFVSLIHDLFHSVGDVLSLLVFGGVVHGSKELVVLLVNGKLERVLVVGEQSVVSIGQVSQSPSL